MRLYILRHAEAEDRRAGRDDDARALTDRGRAQAAGAAQLFRARRAPADISPARIVSSPATRARQTAEPVAAALGLHVEFDDRLATDADVDDAMALVGALIADGHACVIVGHNPTLEDLAGRLGAEPVLKKGQLLAMDLKPPDREPRGREAGRFRADV